MVRNYKVKLNQESNLTQYLAFGEVWDNDVEEYLLGVESGKELDLDNLFDNLYGVESGEDLDSENLEDLTFDFDEDLEFLD